MNFRNFLLYACFITFIPVTKGTPVDSVTAKMVAANFYSQTYHSQFTIHNLQLVHAQLSSLHEAEYYIYNIIPGNGFVIVSADDAAHPILGYSLEGNYAVNHLPPNFSFWMQKYKKQIDYIRSHNIKASVDVQKEWNSYKNTPSIIHHSPFTIHNLSTAGPLVTTIWAQSPYYNADCPGDDVAGCVATAMAQIMKYWAYPPHGISSNSYSDSPYGTLLADFDSTHYNWAAMPLNLVRNNPSVATLMYDCGVSVNMAYSPNSSGSYMISADNSPNDGISAQTAFVQYFGYNGATIQGLYESNYVYSDWTTLLENELNNKRPLMYAGSGDSGSHAWVCDGYDVNGNFHMNWGWGGYEDGYYNLNALNPDDLPLSSNEEALIGIQPAPAVADFNANLLIIRAGDTVNFVDNSFGSVPITNWQWYLPGGTTTSLTTQNPIVIYSTPGSYLASETVSDNEGSNTITRNNYITVIEDNAVTNTVNVYPTLSNGEITIQLLDAALAGSKIEFSLYDVLGRKIYSTTLVQYVTQINVDVPHGMYFFRAFDSSGKPVSTGKLVIK